MLLEGTHIKLEDDKLTFLQQSTIRLLNSIRILWSAVVVLHTIIIVQD